VVVTVSDGVLSTSVSFSWSTTTTPSLPLTGGDIGSPGVAGSNSFSSGVFTVAGGGAGFANTTDQFRFLSETFTGNGQITARVTSQTNTDPSAQAGVMFRETLNANSRFTSMVLTPYNGFNFQGRDTTGGGAGIATAPSNTPPNNWVRIVRNGSTFTGYVSSNGTTWTQVGVDTNPMATVVQVGLAVSSDYNPVLGTATFDNVQITSGTSQ
jgi:regulation of enolase protein 1 (concanavalin A-like superfamily)